MDSVRHMKEVLLVDAIASEIEQNESLSDEIYRNAIPGMGHDLMDSIPAFVAEIGLKWDAQVAKIQDAPFKKLISDYDNKMDGKATIDDLVKEFGAEEIQYLLVMQSVGHGVGLDDDRDIKRFLAARGIKRIPHVYAEHLSDLARDVASGVIDHAVQQVKEHKASDIDIAESALKSFSTMNG